MVHKSAITNAWMKKTIDDRISEAMTTVSFLESMTEQTCQTLYSKDPEVSKIL
jgi:hypothetical protein